VGPLCRARPRSRRRALSHLASSGRNRVWRVLERRDSPAVLHRDVPDPLDERLACVCLPTSPAVVIGSAQAASDFDGERLAASGLELVRRRSGGGAVLVAPRRQLWLDVFLPSGDALAESDVGKSFFWLGDAFAGALARVLGKSERQAAIEVHRGPAQRTPWSKVLCYGALGAGEVTVAGRKVVGMSQRRDRSGAWIHSMAQLAAGAGDLAELLVGSASERAEARAVLEETGLPAGEDLFDPLTEELLGSLAQAGVSFSPGAPER